jgi:glycine/D-amino acid oxidase-like deaminating enzyme
MSQCSSKGYIGSGAAGRNTTILRSNYKTSEGARFYDESIHMYERLSAEHAGANRPVRARALLRGPARV